MRGFLHVKIDWIVFLFVCGNGFISHENEFTSRVDRLFVCVNRFLSRVKIGLFCVSGPTWSWYRTDLRVLQRVAACCSVLQYDSHSCVWIDFFIPVQQRLFCTWMIFFCVREQVSFDQMKSPRRRHFLSLSDFRMLQRVAACCSVLQSVAACCSVLWRRHFLSLSDFLSLTHTHTPKKTSSEHGLALTHTRTNKHTHTHTYAHTHTHQKNHHGGGTCAHTYE